MGEVIQMRGYNEEIEGWLTEPEAVLLDKYNVGIWCELGSWKGKSTRVLAAKSFGYAIDWFKGNPESTDIADTTYRDFLINIKPFKKNILIIKKQFQGAVKDVDQKVDLLFLDAEHSYDATKQAFDLYEPLVKPGGVIIFHDVYGPEYSIINTPWQPVTDFVMDFIKEYQWKNIENADRSAAFRKPKERKK